MTERGEGLARVPRPLRASEQAQLLRRRQFALHDTVGFDADCRAELAAWARPTPEASDAAAQLAYRELERTLDLIGCPRNLPRNAASPAQLRPR